MDRKIVTDLVAIKARLLVQLMIALALFGVPLQTFAQGDGPRAYQLIPEGTQTVSQFLFAMRGNLTPADGLVIEGADLDVNLGVTQYAKALEIKGHQAGLLVVAPYGEVSGSLQTRPQYISARDSGLGDVMLGFVYGILGAPSLGMNEYLAYKPDLGIALLTRVTLPTGSYSSDRNLNMGGNRWAFELGLPIMKYFGDSYIDPKLMSIELVPKVTFYGDNSDAPGSVDRLEQDPIYSLEGHITRNLGQAFWLSLDALYEYGGETQSDGQDDANRQRSFSLGATASLNLSKSASVKLTYGEVVSGNAAGSDGSMWRAQFTYLFF